MLALDAIDGRGPEVYVVLTTRSTVQDQDAYEAGRRELLRLLRDVFGRHIEYASILEFSTGRADRSGGRRRPHWNLLLKGVTADDVELVRLCVALTWCAIEDADVKAQHVGTVYEGGGLMRYLALHFQKEDQSPPEGWSGQRFNCSRLYFGELTRRVARARARESLRWKRELWKAERAGNEDPGAVADAALKLASRLVWTLATDRGARLGMVAHNAKQATPRLRVERSRTEWDWRWHLERWRQESLKRASHPPRPSAPDAGRYAGSEDLRRQL
jgi:hypothetical protein